ncbi:TIR domain-containing protein [Yoonia vestfoldensis]|uniref:TIR domain-containing protein n=1 Tax=Yoonia vestfoldensis TaxID=245188 RepID=UPI0003770260|nr:TIR domain-containing protein [Yoonia vestfoldensis]
MKIFLSHSSRQKLLVREVRRQLPDFIDVWLDEKDINLGDNLYETLDHAVRNDSNYVLLFLDDFAAKSDWVKKEIEWALDKELNVNSPVLLPFVVEKSALSVISQYDLDKRKYISCLDFSEETIASACRQLVNELFAISVRSQKVPVTEAKSAESTFLNAERTFARYAKAFREEIYPYRRENPVRNDELLQLVNLHHGCDFRDVEGMRAVLGRLKESNQLQGYFFDQEIAFLANESVSQKRELGEAAKKAIAKAAATMIEDDMVICIDGGSSTHQMVLEFCGFLEARLVYGVQILTNSVTIASEIMRCLTDIDGNERNASCSVFLIGGVCRPVSLSTVQQDADEQISKFLTKAGVEEFDICFLGANGVHGEIGLANKSKTMISTKRVMFERSKKSVALIEGRKFGIEQKLTFAEFGPKLSIITDETAQQACDLAKIEKTGSKILIC